MTFENAPFNQLVNTIEAQSNYHFYYDPAWIDSLRLTVSFTDKLLKEILNEVLQQTDIFYTIDHRSVYLTKNREILATLPKGLIETNSTNSPDNFDASNFDQKVKTNNAKESVILTLGSPKQGLLGNATITGLITFSKTGEPLPGASVFIRQPLTGAVTDQFGQFMLTIPKGQHDLVIQNLGMVTNRQKIMVYGDGSLTAELEEEVIPLKEITISAEKELNITGVQMGSQRMDLRVMKQMPLALGETDVMKIALTIPGVQTAGEGTIGLNVRGGASNQNLILFNEAPVYNPSHLFGFFSTFNPDGLKGFELLKSGFEANYGGRLSSVLNVSSREGNLKKLVITGGISPITGRLTVEGPIIKEKTSFLVSGRTTYSDWILNRLDSKEFKGSDASFSDINFLIGHKINNGNQLHFSGYSSSDNFKLNIDKSEYFYSDKNVAAKWDHRFNSSLSGTLAGTASQYSFNLSNTENPVDAYSLSFSVSQFQIKTELNYILNDQHLIQAGASSILYKISPGNYGPTGPNSIIAEDKIEHEKGLESSLYIGDNVELNKKVSLYVGLRYSFYNYLGPRNVFEYSSSLPKSESTITDTIYFDKGTIKSYHGPEPRLNLRYLLSSNSSLKFSYSRMRQYIQMLSNTTAISPTDVWKLTDGYIKPQVADQLSFGWFKNAWGGMWDLLFS